MTSAVPPDRIKVSVFANWWRAWVFLVVNFRHGKWLALVTISLCCAVVFLRDPPGLSPEDAMTWDREPMDSLTSILWSVLPLPWLLMLQRQIVLGIASAPDLPHTRFGRRFGKYLAYWLMFDLTLVAAPHVMRVLYHAEIEGSGTPLDAAIPAMSVAAFEIISMSWLLAGLLFCSSKSLPMSTQACDARGFGPGETGLGYADCLCWSSCQSSPARF